MELDDVYELAQRDITESLKYFNRFNSLLQQDVYISMRQFDLSLRKDDSIKYFWYRTLLRSFFAYVEGVLYVMRNTVVWAYKRGEIELSERELLKIKEERHIIKNKIVEIRTRHNSFDDNFDLSMMYFPQIFHSNFTIDEENEDYNIFKQAVVTRNSVTHPKRTKDYINDKEEFERAKTELKKSIIWFADTMAKLMENCRLSYENYQKRLNKSP